jgi:hypothetical protein
MRHQSRTIASLLVLSLAACATGSRQEGAPVQVDAMITWIERVHVEAERSRAAIGDAHERLQMLAAGKYPQGTVVAAYARLVQATDAAEQQAKRLHETVEPMQTAAQPVFDAWHKDVATIANERLRQRSEMRLAITRERYDAIVTAAVPALQQFDSWVKQLRDQATFLAHDLNSSALDEIQTEVKTATRAAQTLDRSLDACLVAARAYIDQAALPAVPAR